MGRNGRQRTPCSGESGDEASHSMGTGSILGRFFHGGHGMGGAEAHRGGLVIINVATREGGRAAVDEHATSLRARGTLPGHFFHGGHGMGRGRGAQRRPRYRGCCILQILLLVFSNRHCYDILLLSKDKRSRGLLERDRLCSEWC